MYNAITTNALNNIMSDALNTSFDDLGHITVESISQIQDRNQNKYVQFNLNIDYVFITYTNTEKIWELDYSYYAKKEIWINDNWYIQYIIQQKG